MQTLSLQKIATTRFFNERFNLEKKNLFKLIAMRIVQFHMINLSKEDRINISNIYTFVTEVSQCLIKRMSVMIWLLEQ